MSLEMKITYHLIHVLSFLVKAFLKHYNANVNKFSFVFTDIYVTEQ